MDLLQSSLQIQILRRQVRTARPSHRHSHPHFELLCISEGHTRVRIRGRTVLAGPGDLLVYHPDVEHEETVQPGRFEIVVLRFAAQRPEISGRFPGTGQLGPLIRLPWPERFRSLFQQMVQEQAEPDAWSGQLLSSHLTQFVCLLQRALARSRQASGDASRDPAGNGRIRLALELIHEHLDAELPLRALAARSALSESRFSHCFKDLIGLSPKQYLIQARMNRACELLAATELPVARIAAMVGYRDAGRFFKAFRQAHDCTPGAWRRRHRRQTRPVAAG